MSISLSQSAINEFCTELRHREKSPGTVEQYRRNLSQFVGMVLERENLLVWKEELAAKHSASTVNGMIAAVNAFLDFVGAGNLKLKSLRCQRKAFSEDELSREEFQALVEEARRRGDEQTAVLIQVMAGSGVRVSEVRFLTVEAAQEKMAVIRLKGKTRFVPLGDQVCNQILDFAKAQDIVSGPVFISKRGRPLDRRRIWEKMKRLCPGAGIDPAKVHPHALRHLFARVFYDLTRDMAKLADLLGHGSIETTRIYVMTSCNEHRSILARLNWHLNAKKPPRKGGRSRKRT